MNGRLNSLLAALLILAAGVCAVSAVQLHVEGVTLASVNGQDDVLLTLDSAPAEGLSGYSVTFTIANPSVAKIVGVNYPSWAVTDFASGSFDQTRATIKVADVENAIGPAMDLGSVRVEGLAAGSSTDITVTVNQADDDNGNAMALTDATGTISVAQPPGNIQVSSTPAGASIFVDDEDKHAVTTSTPGTLIPDLTAETHTVKVTYPGYVDGIQQVTVLSGQTVSVSFTLQKPVTIIVRTNPVECDVFFNSVPKGTTGPTGSVTIPGNPPGFYSVKVSKTGYYAKWINRTLSQGVTSTFPFTLSPATNTIPDNTPPYGNLSVNSTPMGAKVFIDGAETDLETPGWTELDPGEHSVYVTLDGYLTPPPQTPTIVVHEQVNLDFLLQQGPAPSTGCLWPANHKVVDMTLSPVMDQDGNPLTLKVTGITSDEATSSDKGSGGAQYAPDATIGKGTAFQLRSERSGDGNGRVYMVQFTAENTKTKEVSTGSVTVCVPHDQADRCSCKDDGQRYDATKNN